MAQQPEPEFLPAIRRGRIRQLDIYDVSEAELQILERGSPESILLNFAIFLVSIAASFLVALLTTEINSARVFAAFVIVATLGFMVGLVLLALWAWYRRSTSTIFQQIRSRMPPEGATVDVEGTPSQ